MNMPGIELSEEDKTEILDFVRALNDIGIGVQLTEAVTSYLGTTPTEASSLLRTAISDIDPSSVDEPDAIERIVAGAASLEFLVHYARFLRPGILPKLPNDYAIETALTLFHEQRKPAFATA